MKVNERGSDLAMSTRQAKSRSEKLIERSRLKELRGSLAVHRGGREVGGSGMASPEAPREKREKS